VPTRSHRLPARALAWGFFVTATLGACAEASLRPENADAGLLSSDTASGGQARKPPTVTGSAAPSAPGSPAPADEVCGLVDHAGVCRGAAAWWCQDGTLVSQDCGALSATCTFRQDLQAYRCDASVPQAPESASPPPEDPNFVGDELPPPEGDPAAPCNLDPTGECVGDTLRYCIGDTLFESDCAATAQSCVFVNDVVGHTCQNVPPPSAPPPSPPPPPPNDPCQGIDFLGLCNGNVAVWCADGQLVALDCTTEGGVCAYVDDQIGYYCIAF